MPEPIRPTPTRPADTRPPSRPGGTPPPSGPTRPTLPRPGRRILRVAVLVAALSAVAVLAPLWLMSTVWATTRSAYYLPGSSEFSGALVLAGFAASTVVGLVLAPAPRKRPSIPRARAPRLDGRVATGRPVVLDGTAERGPGSIYVSSSWRSAA